VKLLSVTCCLNTAAAAMQSAGVSEWSINIDDDDDDDDDVSVRGAPYNSAAAAAARAVVVTSALNALLSLHTVQKDLPSYTLLTNGSRRTCLVGRIGLRTN